MRSGPPNEGAEKLPHVITKHNDHGVVAVADCLELIDDPADVVILIRNGGIICEGARVTAGKHDRVSLTVRWSGGRRWGAHMNFIERFLWRAGKRRPGRYG